MKKKMIWCSLLSLVLLKIFATYEGLKFDIFPQITDIFTYLLVWVITILAYLFKFLNKKKSLYIAFLIGCLYGIIHAFKINSPYGGSPEEILHTLGVISLLIFIVSFISLEKKYYK